MPEIRWTDINRNGIAYTLRNLHIKPNICTSLAFVCTSSCRRDDVAQMRVARRVVGFAYLNCCLPGKCLCSVGVIGFVFCITTRQAWKADSHPMSTMSCAIWSELEYPRCHSTTTTWNLATMRQMRYLVCKWTIHHLVLPASAWKTKSQTKQSSLA